MAAPQTTDRIITNSQINFGTSGARGLVEQFTDDACAAFTVAFLGQMQSRFQFQRVAIAIDRRPSSPQMAAACAGAAQALGLEVDYYGILPTPTLALQAMSDGIPAIMITGSHIPFDRNGIKFYRPDGEISKADEAGILDADQPLPHYQPALPEASPQARTHYIQRYTSLHEPDALKGQRIGLYEHSAAGRDINREILEALGAEVVSLGRTDEFVPIDTEAVSETDRAQAREWAKTHHLDAIISTDGDGDRPLVADENGEWLNGDILGLLCARSLGIEAIATPVSCNTAIELSGAFRKVSRTRIGSPHVIEAMGHLAQEYKTVAGFEANGGFLLETTLQIGSRTLRGLPTRDAVLPALTVLAEGTSQNNPLSQLLEDLPNRYTASDRIQNFPPQESRALIHQWENDPGSLSEKLELGSPIKLIDTTDGLRATLSNGWIIHFRPSGNAPELRCYCEAETIEATQTLLRKLLHVQNS
ncbi:MULTISPECIES: phosphomannomutase [Halomonadaceae]|uniref:Phosphomannomutase n=1 Tax=Vreelandella halophila TaxID=86177 RepID=A0A9X4Y9I2_9GAMM|nr:MULTISPECIES: phosphomannomutase [Halomonas]MYL25275.1 phosphomannomutase [Halomonas utahensis]MYL75337.1 phosphomannomutase [Halomonas sp. 22501_18_FS]